MARVANNSPHKNNGSDRANNGENGSVKTSGANLSALNKTYKSAQTPEEKNSARKALTLAVFNTAYKGKNSR